MKIHVAVAPGFPALEDPIAESMRSGTVHQRFTRRDDPIAEDRVHTDDFQGRPWRIRGCEKTIEQRFFRRGVQLLPFRPCDTYRETIRVELRQAYRRQYGPILHVHHHRRTRSPFADQIFELLLQLDVHGQHHVFPRTRRFQ